jgi:hypothetical protein
VEVLIADDDKTPSKASSNGRADWRRHWIERPQLMSKTKHVSDLENMQRSLSCLALLPTGGLPIR